MPQDRFEASIQDCPLNLKPVPDFFIEQGMMRFARIDSSVFKRHFLRLWQGEDGATRQLCSFDIGLSL